MLLYTMQMSGNKQEDHGPQRSPDYQFILYTDFLSEGLIFEYQQAHQRINKNQK